MRGPVRRQRGTRRAGLILTSVMAALLSVGSVFGLAVLRNYSSDGTVASRSLPAGLQEFIPSWNRDETLSTWGHALAIPSLSGALPAVRSRTLGASLPPTSMPLLYAALASREDHPTGAALKAWNDVVGFAADPAQPFEGPHDLEVAVAALIYALVDAADLQRDALRSLSPEEVARVLSLPRILASAPVETLSSEETNALVAAVGAGAKVDMLQLHAAGQIVAATISYVLPVLEDWADTRRVAEHVASQRRGDLESLLLIDSPGTRASAEARAFDLLREALSVSAKWGGIDLPSAGVAPEPALETRARAALGLGALEPPETAGLDTGAADALAGLPAGIQRAVARILLAYSQWMDALNQPAGAFPTTQAASALNAQGRLLMAIEESAPALEAWGLLLALGGGAMLPKGAAEAGVAENALRLTGGHLTRPEAGLVEAARLLAWTRGTRTPSPPERPLPPRGGLEGLVLSVYEQLQVQPSKAQARSLHDAVYALPGPMEQNLARVLDAQLAASRIVSAALAGVTPAERSALGRASDSALAARLGSQGVIRPDELSDLRQAAGAWRRVTASYNQATQLVAGAIEAAKRDLAPALSPVPPKPKAWHEAALGFLIRPLGPTGALHTISTTTPAPGATPSCEHVADEVTDCDNDVWFMDPVLQTIVLSGFSATDYDPNEVGVAAVVDPPIVGSGRALVHGQLLTLDLGGNDIYRNNAGGAWPIFSGPLTVVSADHAFDPTLAAVALDLDGDDRYVRPPAGFPRFGIQGAGVGGIGVLHDVRGNDLYDAENGAQGFGAGHPTAGRSDAACNRPPLPTTLSTIDPTCVVGPFGVGILFDGEGTDSYASMDEAQGVGMRADDLGSALVQPLGPFLGGIGLLLDRAGDDRYLLKKAGSEGIGQGVGVAGIGLLVDGAGSDSYRGGLQGQGRDAGLGALVDAGGPDSYSRVHPVHRRPMVNDECWTSLRSPTGDPRDVDPTQAPAGPFYDQVAFPVAGFGAFIDGDSATGCDSNDEELFPPLPSLGPIVADPSGDKDRDGWPDSLEALLEPGWGEDGNSYPAGVPSRPNGWPGNEWPPMLPDGRPVPFGSSFIVRVPGVLAVADALTTVYQPGGEHSVTIDIGGDDAHFDSAGSDFRLSVDLGQGDDSYVAAGPAQGMNGFLLDLGGDDVYWAPSMAQGVARAGALSPAVGLLFDAEGNDRYVIDSALAVPGQGAVADRDDDNVVGGGGAGLALGLLLDVHGDDVFDAPGQGTVGFGKGVSTDVALFLDASGNDRYTPVGDQGRVLSTVDGGYGSVVRSFGPAMAAFVDGAGLDTYSGIPDFRSEPDLSGVRNNRIRLAEQRRGVGAPPALGLFVDDDASSVRVQATEPVFDAPGVGMRVGTSQSETYTQDFALLIDPGGSDSYRNNAGASLIRPFQAANGPTGTQLDADSSSIRPIAAVLVDLGPEGDQYDASDLPGQYTLASTSPGTELPEFERVAGILSQGAGFLGAGFLIDSGGDDTYRARGLAQGFGLLGIGVLWDRLGEDTYSFETAAVGAPSMGDGLVAWPEFNGQSWTLKGRFEDGAEFTALPEGVSGPVRDAYVFDGQLAFSSFDAENQNWEVYVVRPVRNADGTTQVLDFFLASAHPSDQSGVVVAPGRLIWEDDRAGEKDLYWRPLDEVAVPALPLIAGPPGSNQIEVETDGESIVWMDDRSGDWEIFLASLEEPGTIQLLSSPGGIDAAPSVSDSFVVWQTREDLDDDWDVAIYNRKTSVDPLRVLDAPGHQYAPDVSGGIVVFVESDEPSGAPEIVQYDWETGSTDVVRAGAFAPDLDRANPFRFAWVESPVVGMEPLPVRSNYPIVMRGELGLGAAEALSSVHDRALSRMLQGAAWQAGLGLLIDETGLDQFEAEQYSQGMAFTVGEPVASFPENFRDGPTSNGGEPLVQGILLDMEGNDDYRAARAAQGVHAGAPLGRVVGVNTPNNPTPLAYMEFAQTVGLLLDLRGSDTYVANADSQGLSSLVAGAFVLNEQQSPNPEFYAVDSQGILADLGQIDDYHYGGTVQTSPVGQTTACLAPSAQAEALAGEGPLGVLVRTISRACGVASGQGAGDGIGSNRENSIWRQRTRGGGPDPTEVAAVQNQGGVGLDAQAFDVFDPSMERAGSEHYRVTLEVAPSGSPIMDIAALRAVVERTEAAGAGQVQVKRVEFLVDGVLVGHLRSASACAPSCVFNFPWDTSTYPDGTYELEARVQLGLPASAFPIAFVRDGMQVQIDNVARVLDLEIEPARFSPFPFRASPSTPGHPTIAFDLPADLDPTQKGWASVEVRGVANGFVRVLRPFSPVSSGVEIGWDGLTTGGTAAPSGTYEVVVVASDREAAPPERTVTIATPIEVDSVGPTGSCVRLPPSDHCNGVFVINTKSGAFNALSEEVVLDLVLEANDDFALDVPVVHAFALGPDLVGAVPLEADSETVKLTMGHAARRSVVVLVEDDVGNLECAPTCGGLVTSQIAPGSVAYLDAVRSAKQAQNFVGDVPTVASFSADLVEPFVVPETVRYVVNGRQTEFGEIARVGAETPVDLAFNVIDPSSETVTAEVRWTSFEGDPPLEHSETLTGAAALPGVHAFAWAGWPAVVEAWPEATEGLAIMEITVRDDAGNVAPRLSTSVLLDRTAPTVAGVDVKYPVEGRFHAEPGEAVRVLVDAFDPSLLGFVVPRNRLHVTIDATSISAEPDAAELRLAYKPTLDRFVSPDVFVAPSVFDVDATTYLVPIRVEDSVGNVRQGPELTVPVVVGAPNLGLALGDVEEDVFAVNISCTTSADSEVFLEYGPDGDLFLRADPVSPSPGMLHRFEIGQLEPGTSYDFRLVATDPETGLREALSGLVFRTGLGVQVRIDSPESGSTIGGLESVVVSASVLARPEAEPRVTLLLVSEDHDERAPQPLLDDTAEDGRVTLELVTDALPPGRYRLEARAFFEGEDAVFIVDGLRVDNDAPHLEIVSPTEQARLSKGPSSLLLRVKDEAFPLALETIRVRVDDDEARGVTAAVEDGAPGWLSVRLTGMPDLPVGVHRISVSMADSVGNVATASVRVIHDPEPPQGRIDLAYQGNQEAARPGEWIQIKVESTDLSGTRRARLLVDDGGLGPSLDFRRSGTAFVLDAKVNDRATAGRHSFAVILEDVVGNLASVPSFFVVDSQPLQILGWNATASGESSAFVVIETNKASMVGLTVSTPDATMAEVATGSPLGHDGSLPAPAAAVFPVSFHVKGLSAGNVYELRFSVSDPAGRSTELVADWLFAPTLVDPVPVRSLAALPVTTSSVRLAWDADVEDSNGLWFEVFRSDDGMFRQVGRTNVAAWDDRSVVPRQWYRYFVQAVNLAGARGPASDIVDVQAPARPTLLQGTVSPSVGVAETVFQFRVSMEWMARETPAVWLVLDGQALPMDPAFAGESCLRRCTYTTGLRVAANDVRMPDHRFHFEAFDGAREWRFPPEGDLRGPVVMVGGGSADGAAGAAGGFGVSPAGGWLGPVAAALVAAFDSRRRRIW